MFNLGDVLSSSDSAESGFRRLLDILVILRSPEGCPWDREQTPETLRPALVEEAYEIIEAINTGDSNHVREELGDLYLVVSLIATIYSETNTFTIPHVLNEVSEKLIRRHPHVFGDAEVSDTNEVLKNWEEIKTVVEGKGSKLGLLDKIPKSFPPLERALKMQKKAAKAGFDWDNATEVFPKLREEITELENEIRDGKRKNIEEELGDLLFTVVNLARKINVDPIQALNTANTKFHDRFAYIEKEMEKRDLSLGKETIIQMEELWNEAKRILPH